VSCSGAKHLAKKIASKAGAEYGEILIDRFPDTEIKVRLPDVKGKKVYFVQSFYPQQSNSKNRKLHPKGWSKITTFNSLTQKRL